MRKHKTIVRRGYAAQRPPPREYKRLTVSRLGLLERLRRHFKLSLAAAGAAIAGLSASLTSFDSLSSRVTAFWKEQAYNRTLKHPYPTLLTEDELKKTKWTTGELELARLRIDGYLGNLKNANPWMKLCVGNAEAVSKGGVDLYVNTRTQIPESEIDRLNKISIGNRISAIESSQSEDSAFLRINDPFEKLLQRSSKQLVYKYKEKEIDQLDKPQLYLLRNSVYGRHGYKFNTAKLRKYAHRHEWSMTSPKSTEEILTAVERCNVYYLDELHSARELGAMGRGILISDTSPPSTPGSFKAALCTCLAQPKIAVECRKNSGVSYRTEFRNSIDLVIEFASSSLNRAEWSFIDRAHVDKEDLMTFQANEGRFYAGAIHFTAALQTVLAEREILFRKLPDDRLAGYWGVKLMIDDDARNRLAVDTVLSRKVAMTMCEAIRDVLDQTGPFIPGLLEETSTAPSRILPDSVGGGAVNPAR